VLSSILVLDWGYAVLRKMSNYESLGSWTSTWGRWWVSINLVLWNSSFDQPLQYNSDVLKYREQHTRDVANSPPVHETRPVTNRPDALPRPQIQQPKRGSRDIVSEPPVRIPDPIREYRKRWIVSGCHSRKIHTIELCASACREKSLDIHEALY